MWGRERSRCLGGLWSKEAEFEPAFFFSRSLLFLLLKYLGKFARKV